MTKQQKTVKKTEISPKKKIKNPKKPFKMWSAFTILLLIIALLVFLSWILKWAGVTADVVNDQYFKWNGSSWITIDSVNKGFVGVVERVNNDWWTANQNALDTNKIYLVLGYTVKSTVQPMGILDIFVAPMKGFLDKAGIIVFILLIGAFINIVIASKSLEGMSQIIVGKLRGKEVWAIIPLMLFFSLAGTAEGLSEESLGFYMVLIPLMLAAGFDTMTGLLIILLGAGVGVLTSTFNPFVVTIAVDGLNGGSNVLEPISPGDGLAWRLVSWFVLTSLTIGFVMWYALRVQKTPSKSVVFATSKGDKQFFLTNSSGKIEMNWRRITTLIIFGVTLFFMIFYLVGWDSITKNTFMEDMANTIHEKAPYFNFTIPGFGNGDLEFVAAFFLLATIVVGMVNYIGVKKEPDQTTETMIIKDFMIGTSDILSVCLMIATASGIGFILKTTHMQELIVGMLTSSIGSIDSGIGKILILYLIFLPLSFLIPSSSGFATAVFPLLAGITQTSTGAFDPVVASGSITAFSFANGLVNLITPTSGVVMGALTLSRVDYGKYIKFIAPFIGILILLSMGLLAIGGAIGGNIA